MLFQKVPHSSLDRGWSPVARATDTCFQAVALNDDDPEGAIGVARINATMQQVRSRLLWTTVACHDLRRRITRTGLMSTRSRRPACLVAKR